MGFTDWVSERFPLFGTRKHTDVQDNVSDSGQLFVFGKSDAGEMVDERSALQIVTVYACVRLLAESVADLPLHLYRYTDGGKSKEMALDHPLYKLLYIQPNPEMTSLSFRETMMMHLLLWGNAYAQIVRNGKNTVLGLYPLLPELVDVDRNDRGEIYYVYHAYTDNVPKLENKDVYFRRDEILHIPGLGFNGLVGFSPIAMMKNALGSEIAVEKYGSSFFKNGAQPTGVIQHPTNLKDPEKLRRQWKDAYGGVNNANKVAILEEGMSYKPISLPPEDSQFLSTRQFGVEEICRIFRVPPHMVQDLSRSTFSNIEHQGIDFVQHTLMPWLVRFEQGIIKDLLVGDEQMEYFPKFNVDGLMRGDNESRMRSHATGIANAIYTPNEVRQMEDLPPIPDELGGNKLYLNGSYVPIEMAGAAYTGGATQESDPDQESGEESSNNDSDNSSDSTDNAATQESGGRQHAERHATRKKERRE